jgi:hypothetical protein
VRRTVSITLALLSTLALAAPALAKPGGNSAAAAACEDGGFVNWTDESGNAFRNEGACVSYAAHGGTLVPVVVVVSPFSVTYEAAGPNAFRATLTGTGLEPNSGVDLVVTRGDDSQFIGEVADANGDVTLAASLVCVSGEAPITAMGANGTPSGGEFTEYPLPVPDATVCPPPG